MVTVLVIVLNIENIPRRARNYQPPQDQKNVAYTQVQPIMQLDATTLARTMTTVLSKTKRYKKAWRCV